MSRVLLLFASSHGQTEAIASAIGARLRQHDHTTDLVNLITGWPAPDPASYDAVVIGSRIWFGVHHRRVAHYVKRHREVLQVLPTAFFSVCMSAASGDKEPQAFIARFLSKVQWKPWRTAAFAGALAYTKYGPLLRFVMKSISKKKGQPTDTSRDHECTDWAAVNKFAELFATEVTQAADGATDRDQELARILGDSGFPPSPEARP